MPLETEGIVVRSEDLSPQLRREVEALPHLTQYLGPWACEERAFLEALAHVRTSELLRSHMAAARIPTGPAPAIGAYEVTERGVAVIDLVGTMTKYGSSLSTLSHGTVGVRRAIRGAARNDDVKAIMLRIDSPGGSVAGTGDLASDVAWAGTMKPVVAFIEDMGASAAYWVASQATKVIANPVAVVGSIGVYMVVQDLSGLYASEGVKTHVIRAGKFKGAGVEGSPVTVEDIAEFQRVIDAINARFVESVAAGRKLSLEAVEDLADGRVHIGKDAKKLGLVDGIDTFEEALGALERSRKASRIAAKENTMEPTTAATLEELEILCPGADNEFLMAQLRRKATADQARSNWTEELLRRNKELREKSQSSEKEAAEAKREAAEAKKTQAPMPGVKPISDRPEETEVALSAPLSEFKRAIEEKVSRGIPRQRAASMVARERPELREAIVEEANQNRKRARSA